MKKLSKPFSVWYGLINLGVYLTFFARKCCRGMCFPLCQLPQVSAVLRQCSVPPAPVLQVRVPASQTYSMQKKIKTEKELGLVANFFLMYTLLQFMCY